MEVGGNDKECVASTGRATRAKASPSGQNNHQRLRRLRFRSKEDKEVVPVAVNRQQDKSKMQVRPSHRAMLRHRWEHLRMT